MPLQSPWTDPRPLALQAGQQQKEPQTLPPPTTHMRGCSGPKGCPRAPPWPLGGREGGREACRRTWAKGVPTCPQKPCLICRGSPAREHTVLQGPPVTRTVPGRRPALTELQSPGWDWPLNAGTSTWGRGPRATEGQPWGPGSRPRSHTLLPGPRTCRDSTSLTDTSPQGLWSPPAWPLLTTPDPGQAGTGERASELLVTTQAHTHSRQDGTNTSSARQGVSEPAQPTCQDTAPRTSPGSLGEPARGPSPQCSAAPDTRDQGTPES